MQVLAKALSFDAVGDARRQEALGYDGVRVIDHFFSGIPPEVPVAVPHSFVGLGAAAAVTERVLLTETMVSATLRHPVEVAQAVACVDRISGGRAELGMGTGWMLAEHEGTGLRLGPVGERVDRLVEAVTICRSMFRNQGTVHFDGEHFVAHVDAQWPATPHTPEIMVGAHGPVMLRRLAPLVDRIDLLEAISAGRPCFDGDHANNAARLAGRMDLARAASLASDDRSGELRFSATVNLLVAADRTARDAARADLAAAAGVGVEVFDDELLRLVATPDEATAAFEQLAALGIDRVHVRPADDVSQHWLDESLAVLHLL